MVDQTKHGIDEVQLKNKIKKHQDDNFTLALTSAKVLDNSNLRYLISSLEDILIERKINENI
jgi:hypothetical protein|tara:strand:+ start:347 stop:532 length:186 start_codon:yes stop_codon:yes gene_type:complete